MIARVAFLTLAHFHWLQEQERVEQRNCLWDRRRVLNAQGKREGAKEKLSECANPGWRTAALRMHSRLDVSWALRCSCLLPRTRSPQSPAQGLTKPWVPTKASQGPLVLKPPVARGQFCFLISNKWWIFVRYNESELLGTLSNLEHNKASRAEIFKKITQQT